MSNTAHQERIRVNRAADMELHDCLPSTVRRAMADAVFCYPAATAIRLLQKHPAETVAAHIHATDRFQIEREARPCLSL